MNLLDAHHGAIFHCPLCEWTHQVAPVNVPHETLADQFGPGVMAAIANQRRLEATEHILHDHLADHTIVQWALKVRTLQARIAELERIA